MLEAVGKVKRGEADLIDNDATEATYFHSRLRVT